MKLLFAEDTKDLNRAVTMMLQHEGYEVDSVFDGEEALEKIITSGYDTIILDIMMPKMDGLEVLTEIRKRHISVPVMLLTARAEVDDRVAGLDAGADDYLPKPFAMKELIARVRAMTRRYSSYETAEVVFRDIKLDPESLTLSSANSIRLSVREYELLHVLMANADKELTQEILLSQVWKNEPEAGSDTLWLYISYLKGKLGAVGSEVTITGERGGAYKLS